MATERIWRYPILAQRVGPLRVGFTVEMPVGAEIVWVGEKAGEPQMWAKVRVKHPGDAEASPSEIREFAMLWTGEEIPEGAHYVGTWVDEQASNMVWHLFEIPRGLGAPKNEGEV